MERQIMPLKAREIMGKFLNQHYVDAHQAKKDGRKIVWTIGQMDTNAVVAMDYLPVYPENHATLCGARGVSTELCEIAEAHDFSPDLCSYARNDLGNLFSEGAKSPVGGLPRPDLLLVATMCNTHLKWWEDLSHYFGVPLLALDTPYLQDGMNQEEVDGVLAYVQDQLQEHITRLEYITDRKFNWDGFQQALSYTSEAGKLYEQFLTSTRHVPAPITSFDTFIHLGPLMVGRGFPEAVDYYKVLNAEVEERVRTRVSAIGEEVYRLYWDNIPVWFKVGYLGRKFASYGAAIVAASYPLAWVGAFARLDPENPLESIARGQTFIFLNRGTQFRIDLLRQILADYKVDAMVMQMSRSCKPYIMEQVVIGKEVEKLTGLPAVTLEADMVDSRLFNEAEIESRIESFMEMVARSKG